jgi:hypothetical protein
MELFDARTFSKHVLAETIGLRGQTPCRMFGAGKVRATATKKLSFPDNLNYSELYATSFFVLLAYTNQETY